jgi:hypothetical protein
MSGTLRPPLLSPGTCRRQNASSNLRAAYDQLKTNDTQRNADHRRALAAHFLSRQLGLNLFASQREG